ncbi:MAG TPA: EamA family transporter [Nannocystis sp.]|jgi:drug/metabolite transporter (DMT)-like permease
MAIAPQRLGPVLGLLAALSFGVSAPLAKLLLAEVSPQLLAGLLYLGAGAGLLLYRLVRPGTREAPLTRADLPPLLGVVALGGVAGPLLLLLGLARVSGTAGALLLNLEAPLTIVLAAVLFGEHLGRRATLATICVLLGAVVLRVTPGEVVVDSLGVAAIAAACLCWALDNNLTQRLSLKDPFQIVRIKCLAAGAFNTALAFVLGASFPGPRFVALAMALGVLSYGVSVVLDAYALRLHGAAREAAYFATAPFVGAAAAVPLLGDSLGIAELGAMALMAAGVVLLMRERHAHEHVHEPMEHEHLHVHDEHHQHEHTANDLPGEPHAHPHRHPKIIHDHPHVPDVHHRHQH